MEYKILTYRPEIRIPDKYFSFETNPKFLAKVGRLDEDYYHDYFGLYMGDDEMTLAHAAGAIEKLKVDPTNEKAKVSLISDANNYFECVYKEENRRKAYQLIEVVAGFGYLKELATIIEEYYQECEERAEDDNPIKLSQALDFRKLYIKIADKALYIDGDVDTAISFYKLAGAYWSTEIEEINPYFHDENDKLSGLSEEEIAKWNEKAELFEKTIQGFTELDDLCLDIIIREYDFSKMFDDILETAKSYDPYCVEMMNLFIEKAGESISCADDLSRIMQLMIASIKRNRGIQILYFLGQDKDSDPEKYQSEIIELIEQINNRKYKELRNWVANSKSLLKDKVKIILNSVKATYYVDQIRSLLRMKMSTVDSSAYYTSLHTFSLMLPDKCVDDRKDQCGMLSIMNVSYMNDPNEGQTIRRYLYNDNIPHRESERKEVTSPYVFIKCFTSLIDYLPMWQMYGDAAKGVCVVSDWSKNESADLYKVCYINKANNRYSVRQSDNKGIDTKKVDKYIKVLKNIQRKYKKLDERLVFDSMIEPVSYLFKDSSYSYEQEYRLMLSFEKSNKRIKHTKQNPPKLFVLSEKPIQIDELILGPCFENVADTMPYLREQLEKMAERTGTEPPRITISNIDFR